MLTAWRRWRLVLLCVLFGAWGAGCGGSPTPAGRGHAGRPRVAPGAHIASAHGASVAAIAGGGFAGYALLSNGRVWAWGDDLEGQIGSGGAWQLSSMPVVIPGLTNVVAISAGANTAYALQRDGAVWAWGDDSQEELGDAGHSPRQMPKRVRAPSGIVAIEAGMFSAYALRRDGTVWAWGADSLGQLGTAGAEVERSTPRRVQRLGGIVAIAAGAGDGYALRRDRKVWAWGDDSLGQLGVGGCNASQASAHRGSRCPPAGVPVELRGLSGVTAIAAGANTAYALRRDGTVWAWGDGSFGALGSGIGRPFTAKPVRVRGLEHVVAIAAGASSAYATRRDGSVWAWGRGVHGELGDGSASDRAVPTPVLVRTDVIKVAGGGAMAYGLDRHGQVWAWGSGLYGQLGNGYRLSLDEPTPVLTLPRLAPGS